MKIARAINPAAAARFPKTRYWLAGQKQRAVPWPLGPYFCPNLKEAPFDHHERTAIYKGRNQSRQSETRISGIEATIATILFRIDGAAADQSRLFRSRTVDVCF
ncbi:hypothetical protein GGQ88_000853 [Novosphingobium hassiacum]|uniref:Uncharacterized protein n=1 Tax=Novosphingobium hassiacum TaxID=173676 RepID=A0A7W5ZTC7_9SPHN|nr:hypothetical protein [Novosphingobium hassiacum]MBB3859613.1 hypothetical protein [Novosphingobium hassiacum]